MTEEELVLTMFGRSYRVCHESAEYISIVCVVITIATASEHIKVVKLAKFIIMSFLSMCEYLLYIYFHNSYRHPWTHIIPYK